MDGNTPAVVLFFIGPLLLLLLGIYLTRPKTREARQGQCWHRWVYEYDPQDSQRAVGKRCDKCDLFATP
jgi:hypothetical protein